MIPSFDENGNLPPGIHAARWKGFIRRFGTTDRRRDLIQGMKLALKSLQSAGYRRVFIDGSFTTKKVVPGDFDGCWEVNGVNPNLLDPVLLDFSHKRAAQKAKFRGELFPAGTLADASGNTFLEFFQIDRNGNPKGIIAIDLVTEEL